MRELPKWIKDLAALPALSSGKEAKLLQAIFISWEALESSSLPPWKDSNLASLVETINAYSKHAMDRIEELGK